jgi:hypothetical protein
MLTNLSKSPHFKFSYIRLVRVELLPTDRLTDEHDAGNGRFFHNSLQTRLQQNSLLSPQLP